MTDAGFKTALVTRLIDDLANAGRGLWQLAEPLVYVSAVAGKTITVPDGFVTDFASVPRLPVVFLLTGDTAHPAAVIHDFLYHGGAGLSRRAADNVLLEAMASIGISAWRRHAMYLAVRAFGGSSYKGAARDA